MDQSDLSRKIRVDLSCDEQPRYENVHEMIEGFWRDLEAFRRERENDHNLNTEIGMNLAIRAALLRDNGVLLIGISADPNMEIDKAIAVRKPTFGELMNSETDDPE